MPILEKAKSGRNILPANKEAFSLRTSGLLATSAVGAQASFSAKGFARGGGGRVSAPVVVDFWTLVRFTCAPPANRVTLLSRFPTPLLTQSPYQPTDAHHPAPRSRSHTNALT